MNRDEATKVLEEHGQSRIMKGFDEDRKSVV